MKQLHIFLKYAVATFTLLLAPFLAYGNSSVRVATLNLMTTEMPYAFLFGSWESRSSAIAVWAREQAIDVLATQEGTEAMLTGLSVKVPTLTKVFRSRSSPQPATEYTTLFYNPEKFAFVKDGEFWLSDRPDMPESISWSSSAARRAVWVHLQNKVSGKSLFVFNVHFDHKSLPAREQSAKLVLERIRSIAQENQAVLMGDFNAKAGEETHALLEQGMKDSRMASTKAPLGPESTYIIGGWRFDYVYVDAVTKVLQYQVQLPRTTAGTLVSDHQPVVVDLLH